MADALPALHDTGDGPALLLLHAFPLDASQWDHQVAALSGRFRCIRPDYWGCGSSAPPDTEATLDAYAAHLLLALDAIGVDTFAVAGLSMGGYTAFALQRIAAQRITALLLANTRAGEDTEAARADRLALADSVLQENSVEALVEPNVQRLLGAHARHEVHVTDPLRARIRRCTPEGVAHAARAMAARPDSTPMLASIAVPTLVIAGADDAVIPAAQTDAMVRAIPGAELITMDCGHLSNLELPHVFTEHVRQFLATRAALPA